MRLEPATNGLWITAVSDRGLQDDTTRSACNQIKRLDFSFLPRWA
jgi:hypothetical protein